MESDEKEFDAKMEERFNELPSVVQDAITSAGVEKHLRELAETHKLHLDQWEKLENEVMLALLGFQPAEQLAENIQKEVNTDEATSIQLAADISHTVFEPIRQELERQLSHPDAAAKVTTGVEDMRSQILADEAQKVPPTAPTSAALSSVTGPAIVTTLPPLPPDEPITPVVAAAVAPAAPVAAPVVPATPPPAAPEGKIERAAIPETYTAAASHERKAIAGDPYREQL